ncbi:hypothetical protein RchiOBHm_Chr0c10g0499311 [Rosa chinensis]|uniref:Uncharacterized protein n=1 Tax=Rosa chinensis TaxID=74649 RepID=A0A2P6RGY3_ROSCH|nr:hypothetical protein RchiOBHm_Chr3g0494271 [Rosa chinensis]PRQ61044.1 hypothetical protein RchiOBHm_Chr0c10g0499311 [Rosa chinensis]
MKDTNYLHGWTQAIGSTLVTHLHIKGCPILRIKKVFSKVVMGLRLKVLRNER